MPIKNITAYATLTNLERLKTLQRLATDLEAFPPEKLETMEIGVRGIDQFIQNDGFTQFSGELLVAGAEKRNTLVSARLTLAMNAMRWLTKFYLTDTIPESVNRAFRIQSSLESLTLKEVHTFIPHKPMLSWTDNPGITPDHIDGRDTGRSKFTDYLIGAVPDCNKILWTHYASEWAPSISKVLSSRVIKNQKVRGIFQNLERAVSLDPLERELVIYAGTRPFKAVVLKKF